MFERGLVELLVRTGIEYFVTGSVALGAWATFRQTNDVDIVVALTPGEYERRLRPAFEPAYIVNPLVRGERKSVGAVISIADAQKADIILREPDDWGREAFARRVLIDDPAFGEVWISSPEDLLIAKLEFSDGGRSERQMNDCAVLVRMRRDLDWAYVERHALVLGLTELVRGLR